MSNYLRFTDHEDFIKSAAGLARESIAFNAGRDGNGWFIEITGY